LATDVFQTVRNRKIEARSARDAVAYRDAGAMRPDDFHNDAKPSAAPTPRTPHTIGEAQQWFHENDVAYLSTYPSALIGDRTRDLFAPAADNWRIESWLAQLGWIRSLGHEGGLFVTIHCREGGVMNASAL
jgi:hypothetical protein